MEEDKELSRKHLAILLLKKDNELSIEKSRNSELESKNAMLEYKIGQLQMQLAASSGSASNMPQFQLPPLMEGLDDV